MGGYVDKKLSRALGLVSMAKGALKSAAHKGINMAAGAAKSYVDKKLKRRAGVLAKIARAGMKGALKVHADKKAAKKAAAAAPTPAARRLGLVSMAKGALKSAAHKGINMAAGAAKKFVDKKLSRALGLVSMAKGALKSAAH